MAGVQIEREEIGTRGRYTAALGRQLQALLPLEVPTARQ